MEILDIIDIFISFGAFILSAIGIIWQIITHNVDLKMDLIEAYEAEKGTSGHYIFRLHFINCSSTAISISKIIFKYGENTVAVKCDELRLIKKDKKDNEVITDRGGLYSHELPFRIDGYGIEGGNFYLVDEENKLNINNFPLLDVIIYTNKKPVKLKVKIKNVMSWGDCDIRYD